ncbi:MAG: 30S ribosomal protein S16 [Candidatus Margulisbacteria bacterium]|nr:30S ribosomal protein S16 [Candidatus Margulisiibacteriota bacterium]
MAVHIKLQRRGKNKQPIYRVVVQDSEVARNGKVIDVLGIYNPIKTPSIIEINEEKSKIWLGKGALPTKTVERIFITKGILPPKEKNKKEDVKKD